MKDKCCTNFPRLLEAKFYRKTSIKAKLSIGKFKQVNKLKPKWVGES